jgi:hypothetical protein
MTMLANVWSYFWGTLTVVPFLGWVQVKWKGKLSLKKVGFSAWRLSFLWFGFVYIVLFTTGIVKTMGVV